MKQCGEIEGVPIHFTWHALQRMVEMEVTANDVKNLILRPEHVYTSRKYPDDVYHSYGDYTLAFGRDEAKRQYIVKTVLYSTKAAWLKARRDGLLGVGREQERINVHIPDC